MSQNESQLDIQDFDDNIMTKLAGVRLDIVFICISANFGLLRKWTMHRSHPNFSFAYLLTVPRKLVSFLTCVGLHPGFRVLEQKSKRVGTVQKLFVQYKLVTDNKSHFSGYRTDPLGNVHIDLAILRYHSPIWIPISQSVKNILPARIRCWGLLQTQSTCPPLSDSLLLNLHRKNCWILSEP